MLRPSPVFCRLSTYPAHLLMIGALLALLVGGGRAHADEVHLKDGRVLEGEIQSPVNADMLDLKTVIGSMAIVQHFPSNQVVKVVYGKSARQLEREAILAERARLGTGGEADDWWRLSQKARESGDTILAKDFAAEVIIRDRQHAEARKLLGMTLCKGVWMRANEAAVARGDVFFNGRWVSWDEREEALEQQAKRDEQALARRQAREQAALTTARYAAAAEAPYPATYAPTSYSSSGSYYPSYGYPGYCPPRVVYWPGTPNYNNNVGYGSGGYYNNNCNTGLNVHASGGGSNSSWSVNWHL